MSSNQGLHALLEELIDSHVDTIELATTEGVSDIWADHIDYLQRLLRVVHRGIAVATAQDFPSWGTR